MAGIFKFVYIMIIFISLLLVPSNPERIARCKNDNNCYRFNYMCMPPKIMRCYNKQCTCVRLTSLFHYVPV
ncbi:unnamed protein product [Lathyrus oleraceus]